jgi:MFS family permease
MIPNCDKLKKLIGFLKSIQVEPVLLVYMFSSSLSSPTEEGLLYQKVCLTLYNQAFCTDYFSNFIHYNQKYNIHKKSINENQTEFNNNQPIFEHHPNYEEDRIQREASKWIMYTNMAMAIPSVITTLMYGAWSDSVSRKYPIMLSLIGLLISTSCYLLISFNIEKYPLKMFLLPNFMYGLFGASNTLFSSIFSYVSYSSDENNRTQRLAFLESCIMIGGSFGLGISGVLIEKFGFFIVFLVVFFCILINMLYTSLVVKDIRPDVDSDMIISQANNEDSKNNVLKNFVTFNYLKETLSVCFTYRANNANFYIFLFICSFMLSSFVTSGESSIAYLYLRRSSIALTQTEYGYYRSARTFLLGISLLIVLPVFKRILNVSDMFCIVIGTVSRSIIDIIYAFAVEKYQIFLSNFCYLY